VRSGDRRARQKRATSCEWDTPPTSDASPRTARSRSSCSAFVVARDEVRGIRRPRRHRHRHHPARPARYTLLDLGQVSAPAAGGTGQATGTTTARMAYIVEVRKTAGAADRRLPDPSRLVALVRARGPELVDGSSSSRSPRARSPHKLAVRQRSERRPGRRLRQCAAAGRQVVSELRGERSTSSVQRRRSTS
jgi:hypothetical protein